MTLLLLLLLLLLLTTIASTMMIDEANCLVARLKQFVIWSAVVDIAVVLHRLRCLINPLMHKVAKTVT